MFWELYQQGRIHAANNMAGRASAAADRAGRQADRMNEKIDALALACQALWEIVRENTNFTEDHLLKKMEEVDMRDGKQDGKMSSAAHACQACGRKTSRRTDHCIYCGLENPRSEVFGKR